MLRFVVFNGFNNRKLGTENQLLRFHGRLVESSSLTKMLSCTIDRILQDNDMVKLYVVETTDARYNTVNDIFNAISFAVMYTAIVSPCKPQLIINYDATQFKVGYEANRMKECVVLQSGRYNKKNKKRSIY